MKTKENKIAHAKDKHGIYMVVYVLEVPFRLRYIEPGETLERGFWLAEAGTTVELFEAVTRSVQFAGARWWDEEQRPYPASPDDVELFFNKLNNVRVPGIGFRLPSEAELEYAGHTSNSDIGFHIAADDCDSLNFTASSGAKVRNLHIVHTKFGDIYVRPGKLLSSHYLHVRCVFDCRPLDENSVAEEVIRRLVEDGILTDSSTTVHLKHQHCDFSNQVLHNGRESACLFGVFPKDPNPRMGC